MFQIWKLIFLKFHWSVQVRYSVEKIQEVKNLVKKLILTSKGGMRLDCIDGIIFINWFRLINFLRLILKFDNFCFRGIQMRERWKNTLPIVWVRQSVSYAWGFWGEKFVDQDQSIGPDRREQQN